ncbi:MAG: 7TM receptor with intracellular metal dependent phosphohydrolase [Isosphaeraceae bacterium]|jgi:putative nucleotidyltransferase with HDIG domain|nr:MAG: 7TM receptor with intracellular metal dependent phosphohydrolase [Isosphaeraceae bacterium]
MSTGRRRTKAARVQWRPAQPLDPGDSRRAERRGRWTRWSLAILATLATALLVHGTGPPFTFRVGQRPARPVLSSVESFRRFDPVRTNAEKRAKAEAVTPLLENDPAPIRELREQLIDLVDAVARAGTFSLLDPKTRADWGLDERTFLDIRDAADSPERREALRRQITEAFAPLEANGILGPDTLPRQEQSHAQLRVRLAGEEAPPRTIERDLVVPERILKPDGPVAQTFARAFSNTTLGQGLFRLVAEKLVGTPTLQFNDRQTRLEREAAYNSVAEAYRDYIKGEVLVDQDERITDDHLAVLRLEHEAANSARPLAQRVQRLLAVLVLVASLYALAGYTLVRTAPELANSTPRLGVLLAVVVATLAIARLLAIQPWDAELIPVALAGMILAIAYTPELALMVTFGVALLTSVALGAGLGHFLVLMGGTAAGVLPLREVRTRTKPIVVGLYAALGYFVLTWATGLFQNQAVELVAQDSLWRAGWGLMAGFFLGGLLPFIERGFGIVTGISLLELGDINHPLLQELVRRAPGTYNHSVTVGTIAEAAAERIGANGLLVRIGSYFHDIGKMLKPHYFVENQAGGGNRHDGLNPAMSTLLIIGHVKDGADLARQHHLPRPILDLIEQHHGTTLVEYFYREAARRNDAGGSIPESAFRYPGPKPQSREAGILMVADAVESASRTLSEPTPARIEGLVSDLVRKRLEDGQFDECGLTLREIAEIRDSLVKSLIGIYHGRIKYPEQRTA